MWLRGSNGFKGVQMKFGLWPGLDIHFRVRS